MRARRLLRPPVLADTCLLPLFCTRATNASRTQTPACHSRCSPCERSPTPVLGELWLLRCRSRVGDRAPVRVHQGDEVLLACALSVHQGSSGSPRHAQRAHGLLRARLLLAAVRYFDHGQHKLSRVVCVRWRLVIGHVEDVSASGCPTTAWLLASHCVAACVDTTPPASRGKESVQTFVYLGDALGCLPGAADMRYTQSFTGCCQQWERWSTTRGS